MKNEIRGRSTYQERNQIADVKNFSASAMAVRMRAEMRVTVADCRKNPGGGRATRL
jgi:hypothetical protein